MMSSDHVEINPEVLGGKPVIKGTRIPVSHVMQMIRSGRSTEEILKEYPKLTKNDIKSIRFYTR